jgi:hypothetical protein
VIKKGSTVQEMHAKGQDRPDFPGHQPRLGLLEGAARKSMEIGAMSSKTPNTRRILPLLGLLVGLASVWSALGDPAPVYRWTDESGVTVYSRRPPPGTDATRLTPEPGPSPEETQRAEERMRSLIERDADRREAPERQEQESGERSQQQATRRTNCEAARRNLANLEDARITQVRTPEGETQALTDELRTRYLEEARRVIQENCD